jgi:hypothetical protein
MQLSFFIHVTGLLHKKEELNAAPAALAKQLKKYQWNKREYIEATALLVRVSNTLT